MFNLHLYIANRDQDSLRSFNLSLDEQVEILEYDYIFFALETLEEISSTNLELILGNTVIQFQENSHFHNDKFYYYLEYDDLRQLLPNEHYFSKNHFEINGVHRKLSRLFINELGNCSPKIKTDLEVESFNTVNIKSPKIDDKNFQVIIEYLMFHSYFDEKILYKNTLDSSRNHLSNSFLESIKKLYSYSREMVEVLSIFKVNPIRNSDIGYRTEEYDNSSIVDENSLSWLMNNLSEVQRVHQNHDSFSFKKGSNGYEIQKLIQPYPKENFNTYENKVILGFLESLISILNDKKSQFQENEKLRSRNFKSFNDYLLYNLDNLIGFYLDKISDNFLRVNTFFRTELKVTSKIHGFPNRLEGFIRKPHYKLFLDVMLFSQHLFAFKIASLQKFQLEIESFDKLYEVYCLYFLKDTIEATLGFHEVTFIDAQHTNNKLRGEYQYKKNDKKISLYYETFPPEIVQLARADRKFHENPDFILEIATGNKKFFLVIDAKYKIYDSKKFNAEMGVLSYKYLHKIGTSNVNHKVVGLYTLSLSPEVNYKSIYKNKYDLFNTETVFPQIGKIELNPVKITFMNNPFRKVLLRYLDLCDKNDFFEMKEHSLLEESFSNNAN